VYVCACVHVCVRVVSAAARAMSLVLLTFTPPAPPLATPPPPVDHYYHIFSTGARPMTRRPATVVFATLVVVRFRHPKYILYYTHTRIAANTRTHTHTHTHNMFIVCILMRVKYRFYRSGSTSHTVRSVTVLCK